MDIDAFQLPEILRRRIRYVLATTAVCLLLGMVFIVTQSSLYSATSQILLDPQKLPAVGETAADSQSPTQVQQGIDSQIYVMQSQEVLAEAVRKLGLEKDPYLLGQPGLLSRLFGKSATAPTEAQTIAAAGALARQVTVARAEQSLVFTITVKHPDAARSAEIANTIAAVYLDKANKSRSENTLKASLSLQVQAEDLRKQLLETEDRIEKFRIENGLISTGEQGLVSDQQLQDVSQQLVTARTTLEQQETNYNQVKNLTMADIEAGAIPEALQFTSVTAMRSRYAAMLDRQVELQTQLGSLHPQLQTARSQVAGMKQQVEAELRRVQASIRNNYERAKSNVAALQSRFDTLKNANGENGDARTRLRQLESEAAAIQGVYKSFLTRAEELGRQQEMNIGNSRIISQATPPERTSRVSAPLVLVAALLFGLAAGSALAVLRELVGGQVSSQRQVAERLGMPIVARIAALEAENPASRRAMPGFLGRYFDPRTAGQTSDAREMGILRVSYLLSDALADQTPATVLFIAPGTERPDLSLIAEISVALSGTGAAVQFAPGTVRAHRARPAAARSVGLLGQGGVAARSETGAFGLDALDLQSLDFAGTAKIASIRSGTPRIATTGWARQIDYTLVDACGTDAVQHLPALLKSASAILVVVRLGQTSGRELAELSEMLAPWKERMLGGVVVG